MFISCAVPNIKRNMANLSVKVAQLVANETKSSTYVDVEATINDDGVERSYDIHLPVYSYIIGLFVILVGKQLVLYLVVSPNIKWTDENKHPHV